MIRLPTNSPLLVVIFLAVSSATTNAGVILSTDFDSLTTGTVTAADLDSVTSGGTWTLNTARSNTTYSIVNDGGNRAFLADDTGVDDAGRVAFVDIDLDTAAAFNAGSTVSVDFVTATRRTGVNKSLTYEFLNSSGAVLSRITWGNNGAVNFNTAVGVGTSAFTFTNPFDADGAGIRDVSISFDGTNAFLNFDGITSTQALLNPGTELASIRVSSDFSATTAKGVFLDNLSVSSVVAVPEPSSLLALLFLAPTAFLRRKRRVC